MQRYTYICLLLLLSSCQLGNDTKLDKISWLVGNWKMQMQEATFYETWQKPSNDRLEGKGILVNTSGDTLFNEQLAIALRDGILYYEPIVSNQNDGQKVSFKEALMQDTIVRFENLEHDFPQVISYSITQKGKIHAYVAGQQDGKEHRSDFYFEKM